LEWGGAALTTAGVIGLNKNKGKLLEAVNAKYAKDGE
jgi:hypothetical protein